MGSSRKPMAIACRGINRRVQKWERVPETTRHQDIDPINRLRLEWRVESRLFRQDHEGYQARGGEQVFHFSYLASRPIKLVN